MVKSKVLSLAILIMTAITAVAQKNNLTLVVGSYTNSEAKGIASYKFDQKSGEFTFLSDIKSSNPSYLAFSKNGEYIYAANEDDKAKSAISSFKFNKHTGEFTHINSVNIGAAWPCYVNIEGNTVASANYGGGNITVVGIDENNGALTSLLTTKDFKGEPKSHLHTLVTNNKTQQIVAADLGKDKLYVFDKHDFSNLGNATNKQLHHTEINIAKGSGPRHLAFSKNGKNMYVLGEYSGKISVFKQDGDSFKLISEAVADTLNARGSADIHLSHDGKFIYATNRLKGDGIVVFKIQNKGEQLQRIAYYNTGVHPRNFIITPNDKFLLVASRDNNKIQIFSRDKKSGLLTKLPREIEIINPVCLKFAPK